MEGKETWGEAGPSAGEQTALCAAGTTSGTQCNKVSSQKMNLVVVVLIDWKGAEIEPEGPVRKVQE